MKYQGQTIMEIAAQRGSRATTREGARRFLLKHLPRNPRLGTVGTDHFGVYSVYWWKQPKRASYQKARLEARADRIAFALGLWRKDDAEAEAARLSGLDEIRERLAAEFPYRRPSGNWAGGELRVEVRLGAPGCRGEAIGVWKSHGYWRGGGYCGNNAVAEFTVTATAIQLGPIRPEGVILDAVQLAPREYAIVFARQGRGFGLNARPGFLIRGYLSEARTLKGARREAAKARAKTLATHRAHRARRAFVRAARLAEAQVWVTREDSLAAGNCPVGTDREAARLSRLLSPDGGVVGAIRADVLLSLSDTIFSRRAIAHAAQR